MSHFKESDWQAHSASRLVRTLSLGSPSITLMLQARSLTGQALNIHVHQHYDYRLHATSKFTNKKRRNNNRTIERPFPTYASVEYFCTGVKNLQDFSECITVPWYDNSLFHKSHFVP
jgi:hypothetical protein